MKISSPYLLQLSFWFFPKTFFMMALPGFFKLFCPGGTMGKESAYQSKRHKRCGFDPWVGKIPGSRKWQPTPVFLPRKFYRQGSLRGYSPWVTELDMPEHILMRTHTHTHTHTHTQ